MVLSTLNCEDEKIHLCGQIQPFGYMIVFNMSKQCIAISENCKDWLNQPIESLLNKNILFFQDLFKTEDCLDFNENEMQLLREEAMLFSITLNEIRYQLNIQINSEHLFFEFEEIDALNVELSQFQKFQTTLNRSNNIWQTLSDSIYKIIGFDRIMIYQFLEDQSGQVIAESVHGNLAPVLGFRYPEFDIPAQARAIFVHNHSRQTPNIFAKPVNLIGKSVHEIDLSNSQIRQMSPIHLKYLENTEVTASASFSIIVENKLWGLVCCQHQSPKYITLNEKNLCLFITNYAANRFLVTERDLSLEQAELIRNIELDLKEKLFYNQSLELILDDFSESFMKILSASGLIIKTPETIIRYGDTPSDLVYSEIRKDIKEASPIDEIYTTHQYSLEKSNKKIYTNNCSGIARIKFDQNELYSIYWFRKEIIKEEIWAGNPEKVKTFSEEHQAYIFNPRNNFDAWRNIVYKQAEQWSNFDLKFLHRIHQIIKESILRKMEETRELNERLIEINNRLDAYTHQIGHDLRNPLTTIKASAEYLQRCDNLSINVITQFSNYILEATNLINNIIDKTIDSTSQSPIPLNYSPINVDRFIEQIVQQAVKEYSVQNFKIHIGTLHPVSGEKTLLYQLFMNIINNAFKFSSKQEITEVKIESTVEAENVVYYITDNGIGIEEEENTSIFSMFKRLSNAEEFEGTGVGMSIVKRIVERLNANISFDSKLGIGTTFKISFPYAY